MTRWTRWTRWTCVMASCVAVVCIGCAEDKPPAESMPPDLDFSEFDLAVTQFLAAQSLAGATAVIVHRDWGVMHTQGYGEFDADRISFIASASKMVSAGMLMRLDDQGLIDADGPIGAYLDAWPGDKPELTVSQLLSNSSGMPGLLDNPTFGPYICQYLVSGTLSDCARTIYGADDSAQRVAPDTAFRYGGGQWQLAGGVAEVVSGKTWSELFVDTYVTPCGLTHSGYTNQFQSSALNYPASFMGDLANLPITDNPSVEGGMYTTVTDYAQLLLMQLRGGMCGNNRVLSESAVEAMQADRIGDVYSGTTINGMFPGYGLGWWVSRAMPGLIQDAGAYGAVPWIDSERGYGAMIILEATSVLGASLAAQTEPLLGAVFDEATM